ncbi:MAG: UvrD-helicase domain-containing protein, partial [Planctomycetales bacterium]
MAGPGSGKTRTVTCRIANLLAHGIPAQRILALTFTNQAAEEMRSRLESLAPGEFVWTGTFHRFCAKLLRTHAAAVGLEPNYTIYDTSDSREALRRALADADCGDLHYRLRRIADWISTAKNNLVRGDGFQPRPGDPFEALMAEIYPAYQQRLLASNAADFDDLLFHVANLLRDNPDRRAELDERYRYVLVDEYQDTNLAQYAIIRAMSILHPNLCVTGDPDQAIYGWRG